MKFDLNRRYAVESTGVRESEIDITVQLETNSRRTLTFATFINTERCRWCHPLYSMEEATASSVE
jgi:hypothetical protein